jgi:RNA polymerase sigma-70 factor (ECF subfamily)
MATPPDASDEELLAAYRTGDVAAFEALFRRYQTRLYRHLVHMLDDRAAAEDVVIETFQRLHVHRDDFRAGGLVRPWVYTIARNLARNRRRRGRLVTWLSLAGVDHEPRVPGPEGSRDEVERRVASALAALPERQREACSLRLLVELPLEEIARVTGTSVGTVKSRLYYGQRRLRQLLGDLRPDG